ncbi:MAG: hypothetical protein JW744_01460 [Candidatus Diapherotrites archaeon]|uniref:Uncharacterized protein n=1 Tax=Candidatus Iainarchaeum sp. TaxID=3101447 RepID=A0A939C6Z2_9ARCH|nr:hypothetical protein [Candidatus Diapherotrites archaeon]
MPKLSSPEISRRAKALHKATAKHGITAKGARYLTTAKSITLEKARGRIQRMREANAPVNRLTYVLSLTEPKFQQYLERFSSKHRLTPHQQQLFNFLKEKGIGEKRILELVKRGKGRPVTFSALKTKVAFFESIKLDPKRYGVERIPPAYYQAALGLPLRDLKKGKIKRNVLQPLENAHAAEILKKVLPKWRRMGDLKERMGAAKLLRKVLAAREKGIKPTYTVLLGHSTESISNFRVPTMDSLDSIALSNHIERARGLNKSEEGNRARWAILDEAVKRPHLAVNRGWLLNNLPEKTGLSQTRLETGLHELQDIGAISRQNGHISISRTFRTGTMGTEQHRAALLKRTSSISRKVKAAIERKKQRQRAKQASSP